ncbi:MAG TPA: hypothetical protein VED63_07205 [Acidimicrobiales bacterium]|nr:hypothetical protein [Acidimicrobiales bacterium]
MNSQLLEAPTPADPTMTRRDRRRTWLPAVLAVTALAAAACSSSSSSSNQPNPQTTQADVEAAYNTLFDLSNPSVPTKLAAIQDGQSLEQATTAALGSSLAKSATGASVQEVYLLTASECATAKVPSPCAKVKYSILGAGGAPLLGNTTGYAVYVDGHWLVAKATICGLFSLFYEAEGNASPVPGCSS